MPLQDNGTTQPQPAFRDSDSGAQGYDHTQAPAVAPLFVQQPAALPRTQTQPPPPLAAGFSGRQLSHTTSGFGLSEELPVPSGFLSELPLDSTLPPAVPQPHASGHVNASTQPWAATMTSAPVLMWVAPAAPAQVDGSGAMLFTMTPAGELQPDSWPLFVQDGQWAAGAHGRCACLSLARRRKQPCACSCTPVPRRAMPSYHMHVTLPCLHLT